MPGGPIQPSETHADMRFPLAGVDRTMGFDRQPNRPLVNGDYARTTVWARNCRAFDPKEDRARGGSRPGIAKYATSAVNGSNSVQELNSVTVTDLISGGTGNLPGSGVATPNLFVTKQPNVVELNYGSPAAVWSFPFGPQSTTVWPSVAAIGSAGGSTCFFCTSTPLGTNDLPIWRIFKNGGQLALGVLPGNPAMKTVSVCTDGTDYYAVGQNRGTTSPGAGTFFAIKVSAAGTVTWSTANVGNLTVSTELTAPSSCVVVSGVLYASFPGTGIVQVDATTGAAGAPLVRLAATTIRDTGAGGVYTMERGPGAGITDRRPGNTMATANSVLAIAVESNVTGNYRRGVVLYDLIGSTFLGSLLGASVTDADGTAQNNPGNNGNFCSLASDGTNFYALIGNLNPNSPNANNFVVKLSSVNASRTWGSERYGVSTGAIGYSSSLSKVVVSGPNVSSFLDPTTGSESGGGLGTEITDVFDAGNVTLSDATSGEGSSVGGFNRALALVAVAGGTPKVWFGGDWRAVTSNGGSISSTARVVRSAVLRRRLYFVDDLGATYSLYNPVTNSHDAWTPTAGSLPVDGLGKRARLIAPWRDRILLSGLPDDPNNIFASKQGEARNWEYAPLAPSSSQAWALNAALAGQIPDVVTSLMPYSDDYLFVGCDHELWRLTGDPAAGGKIDMVSRQMGVAWGNAWCTDPYGTLYFLSNNCGIYAMTPNESPVQISTPVSSLLRDIDLRKVVVRLAWDDRADGLHITVTNYQTVSPATHYFWERRTGGWMPYDFGDDDYNPYCVYTFQGNTGSNRAVLLGCNDGYVRFWTDSAPDDDGTAISSEVWCGPVVTKLMDDVLLKEAQVALAKDSGPVTYEVYAGATADQAFQAATYKETGTLYGGRSTNLPTRWSGHALYLRLTSDYQWAMENIRIKLAGTGAVRQRQGSV
jgi:hypothetical protein